MNLLHHEGGKKHQNKLALVNAKEAQKKSRNAKGSILTFFQAAATVTRPTAASAQPSTSSANLSGNHEIEATVPVPGVQSRSESPNLPVRQPDLEIIEVPAHSSVITRLRNLTDNLPITVPLGVNNEPLSSFATSPVHSIPPGKDAWESLVKPMLDRLVGFGKSTTEIGSFIRRGPLGTGGFCDWISVCIEDLGISTDILETRLERIMQAMRNQYVNQL